MKHLFSTPTFHAWIVIQCQTWSLYLQSYRHQANNNLKQTIAFWLTFLMRLLCKKLTKDHCCCKVCSYKAIYYLKRTRQLQLSATVLCVVTFGDSIVLDGVFLPEITFSLVELDVSIVFCLRGAWEPDWLALPGPPVLFQGGNRNLFNSRPCYLLQRLMNGCLTCMHSRLSKKPSFGKCTDMMNW